MATVTGHRPDCSVALGGSVLKAVNPASGENVMTMETTAGGLFSFSVTNDAGAETTEVQITADGCIPRVLKLTFAA